MLNLKLATLAALACVALAPVAAADSPEGHRPENDPAPAASDDDLTSVGPPDPGHPCRPYC